MFVFRRRSPSLAVLLVGSAGAAADMAMALTYWGLHGVAPARIVKGIASGWIGREAALAGGSGVVWLGAVSHLSIAIAMVAVYFVASRRLTVLGTRPIACGLSYGVVTWTVMKFIVLPLSAVTPGNPPLDWQLLHFTSHLLFIGLPSAWLARVMLADPASVRRSS